LLNRIIPDVLNLEGKIVKKITIIFLLVFLDLMISTVGETTIYEKKVVFKIVYNESSDREWFEDFVKKTRRNHGLPTNEDFLKDLKETIFDVSEEVGIDPLLLIAVIEVESDFRNIVGTSGEMGMMQIKKGTAKMVAEKFDLKEPEEGWEELIWNYKENIRFGAYYLKYLLDKFNGNLRRALETYNGGKWKEEYAEKVLKVYEEVKDYASSSGGG